MDFLTVLLLPSAGGLAALPAGVDMKSMAGVLVVMIGVGVAVGLALGSAGSGSPAAAFGPGKPFR